MGSLRTSQTINLCIRPWHLHQEAAPEVPPPVPIRSMLPDAQQELCEGVEFAVQQHLLEMCRQGEEVNLTLMPQSLASAVTQEVYKMLKCQFSDVPPPLGSQPLAHDVGSVTNCGDQKMVFTASKE